MVQLAATDGHNLLKWNSGLEAVVLVATGGAAVVLDGGVSAEMHRTPAGRD